MSQTKGRLKTITLSILACFAGLCVTGCRCQEKLEFVEQENTALMMRISELEAQLMEAETNAAASMAEAQPQTVISEAVYLVVEGDTLWSIAKKQLGRGNRYKEILAMNPQMTKDTPLTIGMQLKLPAK